MTDNEIRTKIAEAMGATKCSKTSALWPSHLFETLYELGCGPCLSDESSGLVHSEYPNFPSSLDAMRVAEETLKPSASAEAKDDDNSWLRYVRTLDAICEANDESLVHATARQRALAFVQTIEAKP